MRFFYFMHENKHKTFDLEKINDDVENKHGDNIKNEFR